MLNLEVISEKKNTYTFFLQSFVACINQQAWFLQACRFAVSFKGSYAWIHLTVDLGMINISPNNLSPWTSALHFALCSVSFLFFFHTHGYTCITIIIISFLCNKQTIHKNITWYTIFQIKTTLLPVLHNNWNMSSIFFSSVNMPHFVA